MPRRRKTLTEIYRPYLVQLMSFKDEVDYDKDHEWPDLELYAIRPRHVARSWAGRTAYRGARRRDSIREKSGVFFHG